MQVPPRYSAIKLQGQPAYKRARAGEDVALEPRPITIYQLVIIDWQPSSTPTLTLAIECSKGTYIRSLAYDLGEKLACGAYLGGLIRTRSGPFALAESITLEHLAQAAEQGTIQQYLYPPDKALEQYPALMLDEATTERVRHGNAFHMDEKTGALSEQKLARVYDDNGLFVAIAEWDEERRVWQPIKVFDN